MIILINMKATPQFCCKDSSGEDIYLFTLRHPNGTKVALTNYGAILLSYAVPMPGGSSNDIVLGFEQPADYLSDYYLSHYAYLGAACGRYANRIAGARFTIDNKSYEVTPNIPPHQLHGGAIGFDKKTWRLLSYDERSLELIYISKDGEEGFPGNLEVKLAFELTAGGDLKYSFTATTDRPTAVNLTYHPYFNLNNGEGTIEEHQLMIPASQILKQDENLCCNGETIAVDNTPWDFRSRKSINKDWNKAHGYDQFFLIDEKPAGLSLVAEVYSPQSGLTLQLHSTAPGVQFYTGQGLANLRGKNGTVYAPFSGFCIETQVHPNAINVPAFPNTVLRPGEMVYQENLYRIFC